MAVTLLAAMRLTIRVGATAKNAVRRPKHRLRLMVVLFHGAFLCALVRHSGQAGVGDAAVVWGLPLLLGLFSQLLAHKERLALQ